MKQLILFAVLLSSLLPATVMAQDAIGNWPPLPRPEPKDDPKYYLPDRGFRGGALKWLPRDSTWPLKPEWGVAPMFLQQKAFELVSALPDKKITIYTLSSVGSDIGDLAVFGFREVSGNPGTLREMFYPVEGEQYYMPVISPNGEKLAFNAGDFPDGATSAHGNFIWDLKANTYFVLKGANKGSASFLPDLNWSPGSRYLGDLTGGNAYGGFFGERGEALFGYDLDVLDTQTHTEFRLATDVGTEYSWTYHGTVLYSHFAAKAGDEVRERTARPSVYEVDLRNKAKTKLFDGGYFAQESPDGQWIAFADWPGPLLEQPDPTPLQVEENAQVKPGLYLYHRPTKKRVLVGEFPVELFSGRLQWLPDSRTLFALSFRPKPKNADEVENVLYRVKVEQPQLEEVARFNSRLQFRGTSSDGKYLYANAQERMDAPQPSKYVIYLHTQHTFSAINSATGKQTIIARLKNIASENYDWDFHDDSGINPAFAAAQKIEDALPAIKETQTQVPQK